jgi:phosphoribosyl-ATP pyrophosphohydrolase
MSKPVTIKVPDDIFEVLCRNIARRHGTTNRNAYINEILARGVKEDARRSYEEKVKRDIAACQASSAEVLKEIEQLHDPLPPYDA